MDRELEKIWYISKGTIAFNVKTVSKLTLGTLGNIGSTVNKMCRSPVLWSIQINKILDDCLKNKINQASSERSRNNIKILSYTAKFAVIAFGVVSSIYMSISIGRLIGRLMGSRGNIVIKISPYLDKKVSSWADKKMKECNERLRELNNVNSIHRADSMSRCGELCFG